MTIANDNGQSPEPQHSQSQEQPQAQQLNYSKTLLIQNKLGLHARAATKLVQLANQFDAQIIIRQGDKEASADSVMALLMLESSMGKHITVSTQGPDAQAALAAIESLINKKFDEQN